MRFGDDTEFLMRLDSTAMADIIFNLLIFFLLSSSFLVDSGLRLELPKMVEPSPLMLREVVVTLTEGDGLFINDEPFGWPGLENGLSTALERATERRVIVRGDARVPLGRVIEVMDSARRLGAEGLAIAARPYEQEQDGR